MSTKTMCAHCGAVEGGHTLACQALHSDGDKPAQVPTPQTSPTPATDPSAPSDAAIAARAYITANDALAAWLDLPRSAGRELDAGEHEELSRLENATDAAYEALKAATLSAPAAAVGRCCANAGTYACGCNTYQANPSSEVLVSELLAEANNTGNLVSVRMLFARAADHISAPKFSAAPVGGFVVGKYADVLIPFVAHMERELHANAGKGDRPGWLAMDAETCLLEIYYHVAKLQKAVRNSDGDRIKENTADVANMSMMLLDICGGLES